MQVVRMLTLSSYPEPEMSKHRSLVLKIKLCMSEKKKNYNGLGMYLCRQSTVPYKALESIHYTT